MSRKLKLALSIAFVFAVGAIATTEAIRAPGAPTRADGGPNPCYPVTCGPSGN